MQRTIALVAAALLTACPSRKAPPSETTSGPPAPAASASSSASNAASKLLPDDPNWTRTDRLVRVVAVKDCGPGDGAGRCIALSVESNTDDEIVLLQDVRLYLYDATGKLLLGDVAPVLAGEVSVPAKSKTEVRLLTFDDDAIAALPKAKTLEAEVVRARRKNDPPGRTWMNLNLAAEPRPKGGHGDEALRKAAVVTLRALSLDAARGVARVRNVGPDAIGKGGLTLVAYQRVQDGSLDPQVFCSADAPALATGAEAEVSFVQDADGCRASDVAALPTKYAAFSVVARWVELADGTPRYNENYDVKRGFRRDAPAP